MTATPLSNPPGAITPFATHQTAGTDFVLHLAAFGQTDSDPVCGIIEGYDGAKNVKFSAEYVDPATGTRPVMIEAPDGSALGSKVVEFEQGQAAVTAKYKDVGRIRILMTDDTTVNAELPAGVTGATANFVVRPFGFVLSGIAAGSVGNPAAVDENGGVFVAAGAPFQMTVTAIDAENTPTPNYGREAIEEGVRLATQLVAPAGGSSPAIGWTDGFGDFTNGTATGNDFAWSEVGIAQAVPGVRDGDYLLAGDVTGPPSEPIGRFVPARFDVTLNSPLFTTACSAGSFTYQGEPFGFTTAPVITATAVAVSGLPTENYTGAFFKLTNATLTGRTYSIAGATLDTSGLPPAAVDPAITSPSAGVAELTFSAGSGLAVAKSAPQAPFDAAIELAINVVDADGVAAVGNPVTFEGLGSGIPFTAGAGIRYGRIRVGTAVGSELVDLPVPLRVEHYAGDGIGFVNHAADVCTSDVSLTFPPTSYTKNLNAGETCVRDDGAPGQSGLGCAALAPAPSRYREPPQGGDFNLHLAAPGAGNQGSVGIEATVPDWLLFDWDAAAAGEESPTGQATFGVYGGERRLIYTREIP